jgi:hypothetical protein
VKKSNSDSVGGSRFVLGYLCVGYRSDCRCNCFSEPASVSLTAFFSMRRSSAGRILLVSLSLWSLLTACNEPNPAAVRNDTDQQIEVFILSDQPSRNDVLAMTL